MKEVMELKYIELKSGYNDNGPAWIGWVKSSQSGKTLHFNDHAFQKASEGKGWYYDIETGERYWISGVKKNGMDRHWAGSGYGRIQLARDAVEEYLSITGASEIDSRQLEVVEIPLSYPVERIQALLKEKMKEES